MTMAAFRKLFDSFKTNAQMMRSYAGGHYDGPVTLLRAEKPVEYVGKQTPEDYQMDAEPTKGWKQWSGQEVELHVVAGQHYTMMKEPHVKSLAERLKFCIQNAERGL